MRTEVDEALRREATRFALRFTCEHCVHYDEPRRACGEGYPTEEHVQVDLRRRERIYFCKSFELW